MITPQQIDQVAFKKSSFGGYNMQQVDEFLEPLTEDYVTLYKENALLKSKLRVLAGKLEEYRKSEGAAKASTADAQAERDKLLAATKAQCDKMLKEATANAQRITAAAAAAAPAAPVAPAATSGSVAVEIAHNVEALVGTTEEPAPKAEPKHPVNDTTTSRFANLNLQFGRNYDPTHK